MLLSLNLKKFMYETTILDNGARLVSGYLEERESVGFGIWIRAGARFENIANQGIAHFLEHLLFKGSRNYSSKKIKESIEGVGGALNGFTSEEFCCYFVKIPYQHLSMAADILLDMVISPLLLEQEIEKERGVILEEIKLYYDLPQNYVQQLLDEILWPDHSLGRNILGTYKTIKNIKREQLLFFKKRYYTPVNMVIAACGNLKHENLLKKIKEAFKKYKFNYNRKNTFKEFVFRSHQPEIKIASRSIEQIHLAIGFPGISRNDPRRYALGLLHVILGANMSSRLFNEVREKRGLAYDIGTQAQFFLDTGSFLIHAGIDKKNLKSCLKIIFKELDKISRCPVSLKELKRAKEYYLGQLSISLEDTLEHMLWIGESMLALDRIHTFKESKDRINRISAEEISRIAKDIFMPLKRKLALVGPIAETKEELFAYLSKI